jgi:hypothetical protein
MKFHESPSSWIRVVPCELTDRRTDRYDEGSSRFSQFCDSAPKRKILKKTLCTMQNI